MTAVGGSIVWIDGTNYTLTGAGVLAGGTLTATVAPGVGETLEIQRLVPIVQLSDYVANDSLPAETIERDYDYAIMCIQQLSESIANLTTGVSVNYANIGAAGVGVYAGNSGITAQFKRIEGTGGITATETATQITLDGAGAGIDLAADYAWTGFHSHTNQAARTLPSWQIASLEGGVDIVDAGILLADDYVAAMDVRKNTDVSVEAPVDASWGGNFGIYIQHLAAGTTGTFGTLVGGIRAQVETTQVHGGGAIVNDAVAGYFGLYNNGQDVGGFGVHVDAYHVGTAGASGHTTYGMSMEMHKETAGGVAVGALIRSLGAEELDFGMLICHTPGSNDVLKRGIHFGSPTYAQGGVAGSAGTHTLFDVGIDLTWGNYTFAAISIPADEKLIFSGTTIAISATPVDTCAAHFAAATGIWWLSNAGVFKVGFNMTTGNMFGAGSVETFSPLDTGTSWLLSFTSTNKVSSTANSGVITAGSGSVALSSNHLAGFVVCQASGTTIKIPYMSN